MNFRFILNSLGNLLLAFSISILPSFFLSMYYKENLYTKYVYVFFIILFFGFVLKSIARIFLKIEKIDKEEAYAIVVLGWILCSVFGSLPYIFLGTFDNITNAIFETVSGFTCTGSSVMIDIEINPKSLLFYRSLTHFLGGMGIIALILTILPQFTYMKLFTLEAPIPSVEGAKLMPRIKDTARILWMIYILFACIGIVLLIMGGLTPFDAVCHAFAAIAGGGFSTKNASIGYFKSTYIQSIIIFLMIFGATSFTLHYRFLKGNFFSYFRSSEFKFYFFTISAFTLIIWLVLRLTEKNFFDRSLFDVFFQVSSIITTTGYASVNFEKWNGVALFLLFLLMFIGGMSGSTSGSTKCIRVLIMIKEVFRSFLKILHPKAIHKIKLSNIIISDNLVSLSCNFLFVYILTFLIGSFLLLLSGLDLLTSTTAALTALATDGPGLGQVGPYDNFNVIPIFSKWVLIFCMLIGRLEIYTFIIVFTPRFWKKN
jgi:trk system potassium uptake protein TrkH